MDRLQEFQEEKIEPVIAGVFVDFPAVVRAVHDGLLDETLGVEGEENAEEADSQLNNVPRLRLDSHCESKR